VLKIPPPVIGLLVALAMWLLSSHLPMYRFAIPGQNLIAVLILLGGLSIEFSALWSFKKAKTTINPLKPENTSNVVTTGIYRYSRNPMYLGMLFILTAFAVYLGALTPFLLLPVFVLIISTNQIIPEERILRNKFGQPYENYLASVRRWL
jgi:protein-S-isoprenylcysteine O-methyltransferase Ste14